MDLPTQVGADGVRWRNYVNWYQERLFAVWRLWDAEIRAMNPAACFIRNAGGGALSYLDMKTVGELAYTLFWIARGVRA